MNSVSWLEKRMARQYPHYYLSPVWREVERLHLEELQTLRQTLLYILANQESWHKSHHWTSNAQELGDRCCLIRLAVDSTIKLKGGVLC